MMKHIWTYKDGRGVQCEGAFESFHDHGGTDVTYFFIQKNGKLDVVSGSRLKEAKHVRVEEWE